MSDASSSERVAAGPPSRAREQRGKASALWHLVLARWRSFYREPSTVFWAFGFPIILSIALGIAFRSRPPEPVLAAVEAAPGAAAERASLAASQGIDARVMPRAEARAALRSGRVAVVVERGASGEHVYRYDPTRPESRLARALVDDALQKADGRVDATPSRDARVTAIGARYIDFLFPGLLGMGLMGSGLWGIGFVLVEMRTQRLLKRLAATPMRRADFLLSFLLSRSAILVVELPAMLAFAYLAFGVVVRGSWPALITVAVLGALLFAGMGLLVASRARNTQTVSGLINLASMPMYLCSGVFFSTARFPDAMQPFIKALPLTALNDALRAIINDGAGFPQVALPIGIMLAWGVGCFALSLRIFRWQ